MQMMDLFCWFRVVIFKTPVMHIMHYRWRNNFGARQLTPILARVRLRKVYLSPKTVIASPRRGRGDPENQGKMDCRGPSQFIDRNRKSASHYNSPHQTLLGTRTNLILFSSQYYSAPYKYILASDVWVSQKGFYTQRKQNTLFCKSHFATQL
ncbi:MAG: hypothetical protein A3G78_07000 [Alphaproteobacteria bacterium RIFCSPLOWO2_12_FULL_42_29]|nr:MAG: hypothetical protein A3G78_07000 [Alphaproteobacteria bacterium RIFCSPLOWO2_12_FULL_42_29]